MMMKLLLVVLALVLTVTTTAFVPSQPAFVVSRTALNVVTGAQGKPASSKEEDMELTRQIIFSHLDPEAAAAEVPAPVAEAPEPEAAAPVTVPAEE